MSTVLLTYDLKEDPRRPVHILVKNEMKQREYFDNFTIDGKKYYLPNTTLMRSGITPQQALDDLHAVCTSLVVKVERAVAVEFDNWRADCGEPF